MKKIKDVKNRAKKILLTGSTGQLGFEVLHLEQEIGQIWAPKRNEFDLSQPETLRPYIREFKPDIIINPAAFTAVDVAEVETEMVFQVNQFSAKVLAEEAHRLDIPLIHYSTDYVFDGTKNEPYVETDPTNPLNVYGLSKLRGEEEIQRTHDKHLIIRTAWVYNKTYGKNFYRTISHLLKTKDVVNVVDDEIGNPTSSTFLARATFQIIKQLNFTDKEDRWGVFHLIEDKPTSRYEFAHLIYKELKKTNNVLDVKINPIKSAEFKTNTRRPLNSSLNPEKFYNAFTLK